MKKILTTVFLIALTGCVMGIKDDGSNAISTHIHIDATYQEAYRRADAFARHCHTSTNFLLKTSFNVAGNLFADNQKGVIHVSAANMGTDLERIDIAATSDSAAAVTITVWGVGMWDQRELAAAKQSIENGTQTCR